MTSCNTSRARRYHYTVFYQRQLRSVNLLHATFVLFSRQKQGEKKLNSRELNNLVRLGLLALSVSFFMEGLHLFYK